MDAQPEEVPPTGDPPAGNEDKGQTPAADNADGAQPDAAKAQPDPNFDFNVPLPEIINIDRMSRISDVKSIWRSGIK